MTDTNVMVTIGTKVVDLGPHVSPIRLKSVTVAVRPERKCAVCQKDITSKRPNSNTCGSICRQRLYRHRTGTPGSIKRWVKDHQA